MRPSSVYNLILALVLACGRWWSSDVSVWGTEGGLINRVEAFLFIKNPTIALSPIGIHTSIHTRTRGPLRLLGLLSHPNMT